MKKLILLWLISLAVVPAGKPVVASIQKKAKVSQFEYGLQVDKKELDCLTEAIYHEARGEKSEGQLAVAAVILNRKGSKIYPDSVCKVISQPWQFSYKHDKKLLSAKIDKKSQLKAKEIAALALYLNKTKPKLLDGVMYYHTVDVKPHWSKSNKLKFVKRIGRHKFYIRVK